MLLCDLLLVHLVLLRALLRHLLLACLLLLGMLLCHLLLVHLVLLGALLRHLLLARLLLLRMLLRHLLLVHRVLLRALLCHLLLACLRLRLLCVLCFHGLAVCGRLGDGQPAWLLMGCCRGPLDMGVWKRLHGCHGAGAHHRLHARAARRLGRVTRLALAECVGACCCRCRRCAGSQGRPVAAG